MRTVSDIPLLRGVLPLSRKRVVGDVIAGATLAALAIPEVMGYTRIAGTPVITGLYTMLIPAVLFALFCSSRHLVVGADSATAAILASGLAGMAASGSAEYMALAGLLALMVGVLLIAASAVGLGFMADFLSHTVLVGFLTGVGLQVSLGALGHLLALPDPHAGTLAMIWSLRQGLPVPDVWILGTAAAVLVMVLGGRWLSSRLNRNVPGAMIVVIGAIVCSREFGLQQYMPVVGAVPSGLPVFSLPDVDWSFRLLWQLLPTALAMLVVVLAQSAATARAYAARYDETLEEGRDLTGLGLANLGAGLTGTFVVNGSPTKTEMVDGAGGRSQLSLLTAAVLALLSVFFLTDYLAALPQAVLSAVVLLIGVSLVDLKGMADIFRKRRPEFWVALATAAVVVVFGVEEGIIFAILFSLVVHTRHGYRPKNQLLVRDHDGRWRARRLESRAEALPGLMIYRFSHSMYYANAQRMKTEILDLIGKGKDSPRWFCIDISSVDDVDYSAAATLAAVAASLGSRDVELAFVQDIDDINTGSRRQLRRLFPKAPVFNGLDSVADAYHANGSRD